MGYFRRSGRADMVAWIFQASVLSVMLAVAGLLKENYKNYKNLSAGGCSVVCSLQMLYQYVWPKKFL